MTTTEFLGKLRGLGIDLWVEDDRLCCSGPPESLTPALKTELKSRKLEVLNILQDARQGKRNKIPLPSVRDRKAELPLSFAQERLWFLDRLHPGLSVYNLSASLRLFEPLNQTLVEKALHEIIQRHEILRTTYSQKDGRPIQVISAVSSFKLQVEDFRHLKQDDQEAKTQACIQEEAGQHFDLVCGPLLRMRWIRLADQEQLLIVTMHHSVADAWSISVFFDEFDECYESLLSGQKVSLPSLLFQYADFACLERESLQGLQWDRQMTYWKSRLDGIPELLKLPLDRPRPDIPRFKGDTFPFSLSADVSDELRNLSAQEGVTLFMMLLAIFKIFLFRCTGQHDIVIGSPFSTRDRPEYEPMIGLFVNTLVLRTDISDNPPFRKLLKRIRENVLEAHAYKDVPFEKLVEIVRPSRNLAYSPLFQVTFTFQDTPGSSDYSMESLTSMFDLSLFMADEYAEEEICGWMQYDIDLFKAETIRRFCTQFTTLVDAIVDDPEKCIGQIPFFTNTEREVILDDWSGHKNMDSTNSCIHKVFESQVLKAPESIAAICGDAQLTFRELNRRSNQLAHYLRKFNVGQDILVGLCGDRSLETMIAMLGILKTGAAYVPIVPTTQPERALFLIQEINPPVTICSQDFPGTLLSPPHHQIVLEKEWSRIAEEPEDNLTIAVHPDNLAYVMFTSGSTGQPKGVSIPHRAVVRLVKNNNYVHLDSKEVLLQLAPLSFDASTFEIWGSFLNGAQLIILPRHLPKLEELGETLRRHGITTLWLTAGLFHEMASIIPEAFHPLRQLLTGGDVVSPNHVRRVLETVQDCTVINGYGPTENTTFTCTYSITSTSQVAETIPLGVPIARTQVYIFDPWIQPVPIGISGEIYTSGEGLARGYLNQPEITAETFTPHPYSGKPGDRLYKTGDLGRYRSDGTIEFLGRTDRQVKIRGFRVELKEIESVLLQHDNVKDAAVISMKSSESKRLVGYIVVDQQKESPTAQKLRDFLKQKLPDYMIVSTFEFLNSLPLTESGKINYQALPTPTVVELEDFYVPARNPLEAQLTRVWEEALGKSPIGRNENFFHLGGDSLLAVRLFAKIEKIFGVSLPLSTLFQAPSIEELAMVLPEGQQLSSWTSLVPIQRRGSKPPIFFVHFVGGNVLGYSELSELLGQNQPFYGLQSVGLDGKEIPYERIEDMAAHYIQEILTIQPNGPFFLGGGCMGGIIAFEMAQQLVADGEKVAFLGMLETWLPQSVGFHSYGFPMLRRLYIGILHQFDILKNSGWQAWIEHLKQKIAALQDENSDTDIFRRDKSERNSDMVTALNYQAFCKYKPKQYQGPVTYFLASDCDGVDEIEDPRLDWEEFCVNGFEVFRVDVGTAGELVKFPHVQVLANHLNVVLSPLQKN